MRHKIAAFALILAFLVGGDDVVKYEQEAYANTAFSFSLFFNQLAPYGNWVPINGYGYGWYPAQAGPGWQPYLDGQWVWSDQGWTWASNEPWGWATYHYGRWIYDSYYGWIWIPGTVWAPAWVSWYQSPGYVGWSPLPPDNNFFIEIGIGFSNYGYGPYYGGYYGGGYYGGGGYYNGGGNHGHYYHHDKGHYYDNGYYAQGDHCVFVPENKFSNRNAKLERLDGERNLTVMRNVKNVTNIKVENNKIYNYGPDKSEIERVSGGKIRPVNLVDSDLATLRAGKGRSTLDNNNYRVFRPGIERKSGETPFTGENNGWNRAQNGSNSKAAGENNAFTAGERNTGNNLVQNRSNDRPGNRSYGNVAPEDYGVIKKNAGRNNGPASPDYGRRMDYPGSSIAPDNSQGVNDGNAVVTNRQRNTFPGQPVNNGQNRAKNNVPANGRLRGSQTDIQAQQMPAVNRSPYSRDRGPGSASVNPYQNTGRKQTYNRPVLSKRKNYNTQGYNAQTQHQAPRYNSQPSQRQTKASSYKKTTNTRSGRSYSPPPAQYTSPYTNTQGRSYNPGSTRSVGGNSFVQNSGRR